MESALTKAIDSGDTDLVYLALFRLAGFLDEPRLLLGSVLLCWPKLIDMLPLLQYKVPLVDLELLPWAC